MTDNLKHFLDIDDLSSGDLRKILDEAKRRKAARKGWPKGRVDEDAPLEGHILSMIFEKSSTRTRYSFDVGMTQLGGRAIITGSSDMQLGRGETIEDTAGVLSRYVDAIMIRANSHEDVKALATASSVPVINGLTNFSHPCQIIAALQMMEERGLDLKTSKIAWVGDGNNVAHSFIQAAPKFGYEFAIATPQKYQADINVIENAQALQGRIHVTDDPKEAVQKADVVIADTWVSMGDKDYDERLEALRPYQVDLALMAESNNALFSHCLPAHRGEEVTSEVIDGPNSTIFDEAENRTHAQKAILLWCLGKI